MSQSGPIQDCIEMGEFLAYCLLEYVKQKGLLYLIDILLDRGDISLTYTDHLVK